MTVSGLLACTRIVGRQLDLRSGKKSPPLKNGPRHRNQLVLPCSFSRTTYSEHALSLVTIETPHSDKTYRDLVSIAYQEINH